YLDNIIGELVDSLRAKDMWDNTLLVVSSDNGGEQFAGNNYPLKGLKASDWQGGVRVNAFISGGYLPKDMRGTMTDEYIHLADWYATFSNLADVDPTDELAASFGLPEIDSLDMWPLTSG
ncbi:MAG: sulfatase-like hydrolase/transferase, partial [Proteobacteria bacterium]|nr:sulfatase-like hydrolase/transferase [Pseudomonadota bacterium]